MQSVALVILLSLLQYWVFTVQVVRYRTKNLAPTMSGSPGFERSLRVQLNTAERLIVFIPAVWFFGVFVDPFWATILGAVFLVGRTIFAIGYLKSPPKRTLGKVLSSFSELALLLGAIAGLIVHWNLLS